MHRHNHPRILLSTLLLYAASFALCIFTAYEHYAQGGTSAIAPSDLGWLPLVLFLVLPFLLVAIIIQRDRMLHRALSALLFLGFGMGAFFIAIHTLDRGSEWPTASIIFIFFIAFARRVYSQNLAVIVGIAGICAVVGIYLTPVAAAVTLMLASLYDFFTVYGIHSMQRMAGEMLHAGSVFGFLVPSRWSDWLLPTKKALEDESIMILGAGDIGLPLIMSVSLLSRSMTAAIVSAVFSMLGVCLLHWLFFYARKGEHPVAALPPLAATTLLGYALILLLNL
jgi:presenilin-like A22 family membrane protease